MFKFGGKTNFTTTYIQDFPSKKNNNRTVLMNPRENNSNNVIMCGDDIITMHSEDERLACGYKKYFYQDVIEKIKNRTPKIGKIYFKDNLDVSPILRYEKDLKKTVFQIGYCKDELLESDVHKENSCEKLSADSLLPLTTQQSSYRNPSKITVKKIQRTTPIKQVEDNSLQKKIEEIIETKCGDTTYGMCHSLLGQAVLEAKPYGEPNEAPLCSRWQGTPGNYRYLIR